MKHAIALLALTLPMAANAAPFADANPAEGKALHQKWCSSCHVSRYGGDGNRVYTRNERKIKSASSLAQQITRCSTSSDIDLFPEDEAHIAAYLNQTFYHFK